MFIRGGAGKPEHIAHQLSTCVIAFGEYWDTHGHSPLPNLLAAILQPDLDVSVEPFATRCQKILGNDPPSLWQYIHQEMRLMGHKATSTISENSTTMARPRVAHLKNARSM
jgi:hypothetical protein